MKKQGGRVNKRGIWKKGQAMVLVIVVSVVLLVVAGAAAAMVVANILALSREEQGILAYSLAESAVEEGILRSLRDPGLEIVSEEIIMEGGVAELRIVGSDPKVITATGTKSLQQKTIEVVLRFDEGQLVIDSWNEI